MERPHCRQKQSEFKPGFSAQAFRKTSKHGRRQGRQFKATCQKEGKDGKSLNGPFRLSMPVVLACLVTNSHGIGDCCTFATELRGHMSKPMELSRLAAERIAKNNKRSMATVR
eukprot:6204852-Amphidinium_carterae.2